MRKDLWKLAVPAAALLLALSGCSGQKAPEETAASAGETQEEQKEETAESLTPEESSEAAAAEEQLSALSVPKLSPEEYPGVNGSTATLPLSYELYHLSTGVPLEEAERTIAHSKTTAAYFASTAASVSSETRPMAWPMALRRSSALSWRWSRRYSLRAVIMR